MSFLEHTNPDFERGSISRRDTATSQYSTGSNEGDVGYLTQQLQKGAFDKKEYSQKLEELPVENVVAEQAYAAKNYREDRGIGEYAKQILKPLTYITNNPQNLKNQYNEQLKEMLTAKGIHEDTQGSEFKLSYEKANQEFLQIKKTLLIQESMDSLSKYDDKAVDNIGKNALFVLGIFMPFIILFFIIKIVKKVKTITYKSRINSLNLEAQKTEPLSLVSKLVEHSPIVTELFSKAVLRTNPQANKYQLKIDSYVFYFWLVSSVLASKEDKDNFHKRATNTYLNSDEDIAELFDMIQIKYPQLYEASDDNMYLAEVFNSLFIKQKLSYDISDGIGDGIIGTFKASSPLMAIQAQFIEFYNELSK